MPSMHAFCCVGSKSVSNLCSDLFIFQGIANLCFALSNQMPESQIMTKFKGALKSNVEIKRLTHFASSVG